MVPLLKYGLNLNESVQRMESRLNRMNPSDFRYKMGKGRLDMIKSSFMSYRVVFENKARQQTTNWFFRRLLENFIETFE